MSTYSNKPQKNNWEIWFITSVILFLSMMLLQTISESNSSSIIKNILLLVTIANLISCIIIGSKN